MAVSRAICFGSGLVVIGLLLCGSVQSTCAQSGVGSIEAVSMGGSPSAVSGGVRSLYTNPAHLTVGEPEYRFEMQWLRVGAYSGGDLFQFNHYSDLFVHQGTSEQNRSDAEEMAILEEWFGASTRQASTSVEVVPLAMTYRSAGGQWGVGIGIRGRVVQTTALNKGLFDLLLRGTGTDRTVPIDGHTRLYSTVDLTGTVSYRFSGLPLSVGVSPRVIFGTAYADGVLTSEVEIRDHGLTHRFDYTARAAGPISTGLYDTFDVFSAQPVRTVVGTPTGIAGIGGGLDAGVNYAVGSGLHLSMSVTNLGMIQWEEGAQTVTPTHDTFHFEGVALDLRRLNDEFDGDARAYVEHQVDSLARAAYQDVERERAPFQTRTPATVGVSSTWDSGTFVINGGVSMGVGEPGRFGARPPAVHMGGELDLGPVPVRAGIRLLGTHAATLSGGVGLDLGTYGLDVGGSVTPSTSLLGSGARYAVSASLGTIRK